MNRVLRRSVEYAFAHRDASLPFVREHAQEMSEEVMYAPHRPLRERVLRSISGAEGRRAVELLFERAASDSGSSRTIRSMLCLCSPRT